MAPSSSLMLTPASSTLVGSSRIVVCLAQPPSCASVSCRHYNPKCIATSILVCESAKLHLRFGIVPWSVEGGRTMSGCCRSRSGLRGPGISDPFPLRIGSGWRCLPTASTAWSYGSRCFGVYGGALFPPPIFRADRCIDRNANSERGSCSTVQEGCSYKCCRWPKYPDIPVESKYVELRSQRLHHCINWRRQRSPGT